MMLVNVPLYWSNKKAKQQMRNSHICLKWAAHMKKEESN